MASTYTPIATTTLSTTASNITFNSISGSYTDLILVASPIGTASLQVKLTFNNDANSNYSYTGMSGNGSIPESYRGSSATAIFSDYYYSVNTTAGMLVFNIMNYSNTSTYKSALIRANNAGTATMANIGLWRSTSAINRVDLSTSTSTFAAGSKFTLYGIKAA